MNELFGKWPELATRLPRIVFAELPTPVRRLTGLSERFGHGELWVKDDGLSSPHYGGNKVRKLELLLGHARRRNRRRVLTFGYAGSNHAAATAVYAAAAGMRSTSMLLPQDGAPYVRRNLLVSAAAGAELIEARSTARLAARTVATLARHTLADRNAPMVIPPGGSSALGTVGFVGAAFELAAQIERGELPTPTRVYAAAGSLGTVVGLALGLKTAGLDVPVEAVRVADSRYVNRRSAERLFRSTLAVLRRYAPRFPEVALEPGDLRIRDDQFGPGYAVATAAGRAAVEAAERHDGLTLDPTYTGKTLAALLADLTDGDGRREHRDGPLLFWNTYNSADLGPLAATVSAADLPSRFHKYFA